METTKNVYYSTPFIIINLVLAIILFGIAVYTLKRQKLLFSMISVAFAVYLVLNLARPITVIRSQTS